MARRKAVVQTTEVVTRPADGTFPFMVTWHIKHDGRRYAPGEVIELRLDEAARLIDLRAVVALAKE